MVDNGSADGSAEFVRQAFPHVKVLALDRNLGFGGGSNAGFRAAKNDIVVLLNSDMRVAPDFLAPLLEGFSRRTRLRRLLPDLLSRSGQAARRDRADARLVAGWRPEGAASRPTRPSPDLFPCFYGGGGSCAFDRRKFLELGGFDELLAPFYLEDTDLGYMAWKRGWKVLYQPRSIVYHEHRGTIGKRFSEAQIQAVLKKNYLLFCWKNIHDWRRLAAHFFFSYGGALVSVASGDVPGRANLRGWWRAFRQLPGAIASRWRARASGGGGRYGSVPQAARADISGTGLSDDLPQIRLANLARAVRLALSDLPAGAWRRRVHVSNAAGTGQALRRCTWWPCWTSRPQAPAQEELRDLLRVRRIPGRARPRPRAWARCGRTRSPSSPTTIWTGSFTARSICTRIDVVQLEYTPLGQYARAYRHIPTILFEHDIYFQSIARGLEYMHGTLARIKARYEYLRALRYELGMLPRCDRVQVCTRENGEYLAGFLPRKAIARAVCSEGLRAGIDTARYDFSPGGREPFTMLFLGSFRHEPNIVALDWFVNQVLPRIVARRPEARLVVVGSDAPPRHPYADRAPAIEIRGFVEDIREPLGRYAVFVCPVRSGSGVRVKLLEAFASGIPVVSTRIGAEGLARQDGEFCCAGGRAGAVRREGATGFRQSAPGRGDGRARARRSRGKLGHGRHHRAAGGELSGSRAGKESLLRLRREVLFELLHDALGGVVQLVRTGSSWASRRPTKAPGGTSHPPGKLSRGRGPRHPCRRLCRPC